MSYNLPIQAIYYSIWYYYASFTILALSYTGVSRRSPSANRARRKFSPKIRKLALGCPSCDERDIESRAQTFLQTQRYKRQEMLVRTRVLAMSRTLDTVSQEQHRL